MRHYFGYDINGNLRSYEANGPVGWPPGQCLADTECQAIAVTSLRNSRAITDPDIIGWVPFDCSCNVANGETIRDCKCVDSKFAESYVDVPTKTLRSKPLRSVYIDDVLIADQDVITRAPGTPVRLKVASEGAENGSTVVCAQRGPAEVALETTWEMTFLAGVTEEKVLIAPAQGSRGAVVMAGARVRPFRFFLRGFAGA